MKNKTRSTIIAAPIILYVGICLLWGWFSTSFKNLHAPEWTTHSISESQARNFFISPVNLSPSEFQWKDSTITVKEAWIEYRSELKYTAVLIPRLFEWPIYTRVDGYNLCLKLSKHNPSTFFVLEDRRNGFASIGELHSEFMDKIDIENLNIKFTDNWEFKNAMLIQATITANKAMEATK
jgi:hypothetical protein